MHPFGSNLRGALAPLVLFGVLMVIVARTVLDYGLSWDEEQHRFYGDAVMRWYATLGQDRDALFQSPDLTGKWGYMSFYGGIFEVFAHVIGGALPVGVYEGRHVVSALFGLAGIGATYAVGAHLGRGFGGGPPTSTLAGFLAALFLALTPVFYGQMFFNPKDIPFAALHMIALYALCRLFDAWPHPSKRLLIGTGVAIGSTLGMRVGGIVLFGYLALLAALWVGARGVPRGRAAWRNVSALAGSCAIVVVLSWLVMLAWWPWAQVNPLGNPLDTLRLSIYFNIWEGILFFDGQTYPGVDVPRAYLPVWFGISLPELYFLALALAVVVVVSAVVRGRRATTSFGAKVGLLAMAAAFPVAVAILGHSIVYDGLRLFLFVLPPLAALAGLTVAHFLSAPRYPLMMRLLVGGALVLSLAVTIADLVRLHPYEYVYFNRLVAGGQEAGARRFETDNWGLSYKEGTEWLVANYHPSTSVKPRIGNCSRPILSNYPLAQSHDGAQRFEFGSWDTDSDILLATTRFGCHVQPVARVLHVVERAGIPLLYVLQLSGGTPVLIADPNPLPRGLQPGTATIAFNTQDGSTGQLYVSVDGEPEQLVAQKLRDIVKASWIESGRSYVFTLYAGTTHVRRLASLEVARQL